MPKPEQNKDWIIDNIRNFIHEKGIKLENLSTAVGISQGELSKILNGERKDYYKHIPNFAINLRVSFHQLVERQNENQYNIDNETINKNKDEIAHILEQKDESIKKLLNEKDIVIKTQSELIALLKKDLENMDRKYNNAKQKLIGREKELNDR